MSGLPDLGELHAEIGAPEDIMTYRWGLRAEE